MKKKTQWLILLGAMTAGTTTAQESADPFADDTPNSTQKKQAASEVKTIRVVYEVFSLSMKEAGAIQRSGIDDKAFYEKMLAGLKNNSVKQETFSVARTVPGGRVTTEEIGEYIYNTEAEPPELPNLVASTKIENPNGNEGEVMDVFPVTPATPSAFDTKNLGKTLEIEAQIGNVGTLIELLVAGTEVTLIGLDSHGQGMSTIKMPRFAVSKIGSSITARSGAPSYLGTVSPPFELQPEDGEARTAFAFITASIVKL